MSNPFLISSVSSLSGEALDSSIQSYRSMLLQLSRFTASVQVQSIREQLRSVLFELEMEAGGRSK